MARTPTKNNRTEGIDPRSDVLFKVYSNFAGIGTDVADMIAECAMEPARMKALLERLKVECTAQDLDSRLNALSKFAGQVGETQFVMRLRHEVWKVIRFTEKVRSESKMQAVSAEVKSNTGSKRNGGAQSENPTATPGVEFRGPDRRRVVGDRRSHLDRRGYPEGMGTDKRSGRDRRKHPHGRRKSDSDRLM